MDEKHDVIFSSLINTYKTGLDWLFATLLYILLCPRALVRCSIDKPFFMAVHDRLREGVSLIFCCYYIGFVTNWNILEENTSIPWGWSSGIRERISHVAKPSPSSKIVSICVKRWVYVYNCTFSTLRAVSPRFFHIAGSNNKLANSVVFLFPGYEPM